MDITRVHCYCGDKGLLWEGGVARRDSALTYHPTSLRTACSLEPFTCKGGKMTETVAAQTRKKCKCPDKNCHICPFTAAGASISGQVCTRCGKFKYLSEGSCVDACPEGTESIKGSGKGKYGSECKSSVVVPTATTTEKPATTTTTTQIPATTTTTEKPATTVAATSTAGGCAVNTCMHGGQCTDGVKGSFTCACADGFSGPLCETAAIEEIACDGTDHFHARYGCQSCDGNLGTFYLIKDMGALSAVLKSPIGIQRVGYIMQDYPGEYFGGKKTSFGILMRPRKESEENDGEQENICLSILVPGMSSTAFQAATFDMLGVEMGTLLQFPEGFGENPLDKAEPGDFSMPLKFLVNQAAEPEEPERRSIEGAGARSRREADEAGDASNTMVARQAGFLDTLIDPSRGLANLFMPTFTMNGIVMDNMYFKLFWLGVGFHPPAELTVKNIGDAICPSCGSNGKGPMTTALEFVDGWPIVGELTGLLFNAHIHYIAIRADNGVRTTASILTLLGYTGSCGYSARGGASCSKSTSPPPPPAPRFKDKAGQVGNKIVDGIKQFLSSYAPSKLTFDLHIDTQFTTPSDPLDLGKLFTGSETPAKIDNLNMRFEIINIFNRLNTPRDYCEQSFSQNGGEENRPFDFEPPQARALNIEIAASWDLGGLPLEIAFRREQNTKQGAISAGRKCSGSTLGAMSPPRQATSQIGKNSWFIILRLPRITVLQIVCMAKGINPGISPDNIKVAESEAQKCNELFNEEMGWVPQTIVTTLLSTGLDKPTKYGGRQGPLLPANGEYLGPQISIQLTGLNPLNWVWQFQGIITLFNLPLIPFDLKFGRGPYGADAVAAGGAKIPVTQLPKTQARRRRIARAAGGPALLTGFEFTTGTIGDVIRNLIQADFVATAIDTLAGVASGSIGFVITSQNINTFATPALQLDLEVLRGMPVIPMGLTAIVVMRMAQPCQNQFCGFIVKHLGDVSFRLWANINVSPPGMAMGAQLNNIIITRDSCPGEVGSMYELGRPTFELSSVGIFMIAGASGITFGFNVFLTIDIGNIRGGDNCAYQPVPGEAYKFLEPLTFLVQISVTPMALYLEGAMIGIWTRALGLDMLHFGNLQLGLGFDYITGISSIEAGGELVLGKARQTVLAVASLTRCVVSAICAPCLVVSCFLSNITIYLCAILRTASYGTRRLAGSRRTPRRPASARTRSSASVPSTRGACTSPLVSRA